MSENGTVTAEENTETAAETMENQEKYGRYFVSRSGKRGNRNRNLGNAGAQTSQNN